MVETMVDDDKDLWHLKTNNQVARETVREQKRNERELPSIRIELHFTTISTSQTFTTDIYSKSVIFHSLGLN
jgi:hypothetical protein